MMNPITTSKICVGYTAMSVLPSVPAGNCTPNCEVMFAAVDGGAPSGNRTENGPLHGRP